MKRPRFKSTGTKMGRIRTQKGGHSKYEFGQVPRLNCGRRDCVLKTDWNECKIIKWGTCNREDYTVKACGNLYVEFKGFGYAVGYRDENMNSFSSYLYHPTHMSLRRKKAGLEFGANLKVMVKASPVIGIANDGRLRFRGMRFK